LFFHFFSSSLTLSLSLSLSLLDIVDAPGATGDYHTDLLSKGRTGVHTLVAQDYDFGFVHVKAVDDAGHDRYGRFHHHHGLSQL
jgi:2,3-bisphosphoglycerate-independent phosphoglycerate mutase